MIHHDYDLSRIVRHDLMPDRQHGIYIPSIARRIVIFLRNKICTGHSVCQGNTLRIQRFSKTKDMLVAERIRNYNLKVRQQLRRFVIRQPLKSRDHPQGDRL